MLSYRLRRAIYPTLQNGRQRHKKAPFLFPGPLRALLLVQKALYPSLPYIVFEIEEEELGDKMNFQREICNIYVYDVTVGSSIFRYRGQLFRCYVPGRLPWLSQA